MRHRGFSQGFSKDKGLFRLAIGLADLNTRGDGMGSWRKSYKAYKRLAAYRDGEYASSFVRDNLRNLLAASLIAGGALSLDTVFYVLTGPIVPLHLIPLLALTAAMGVSCALIIYVLDHPSFTARRCIAIRNLILIGLLVEVVFFIYGELALSGGLYVYTVALLVLVAVPNFRIHETFLIMMFLNISVLLIIQLGLASFPTSQAFIAPWRYMLFCTVIAMASAVRRHTDYLLLVHQRATLQAASETDTLTNLMNRRGMEDYLKKRDYRWNVSLALFDIDDFKSYNDTYGHAAGDDCLKQAAACFRAVAEKCDAIAVRYGGEEFILLFFLADHDEARRQAGECLDRMRARKLPSGTLASHRYVTLSAGLAVSTAPLRQDIERCYALAAQADRNLYTAKACGKDQCIG